MLGCFSASPAEKRTAGRVVGIAGGHIHIELHGFKCSKLLHLVTSTWIQQSSILLCERLVMRSRVQSTVDAEVWKYPYYNAARSTDAAWSLQFNVVHMNMILILNHQL